MTRLELLEIAKPILFNTEMVRAIQNHNKTVTRRKVKPQPPKKANGIYERMDNGNFQMKVAPYEDIYDYEIIPPYQVGDYLYVRETWATTKSNACIANELGNCPHKSCDTADGACFADEYIYKADDLSRTDVKWHPLNPYAQRGGEDIPAGNKYIPSTGKRNYGGAGFARGFFFKGGIHFRISKNISKLHGR